MGRKKSTKPDITQTGHLTYKDLQQINNSNQQGYSQAYLDVLSNDRIRILNNSTRLEDTPVRSSLYTQTGGKDYFGKSKYDPDIATDNQFEDLNETRANRQSWWDALGNGIAKMAGKAINTIAGTAGLLHGLGKITADAFDPDTDVKWSDIWNNETFDVLSELDNSMEDAFKVYATKAEQDADWWTVDYLTSKKFWADSVITNVGFTLGAMATGAGTAGILGKGLSLFGRAAQLGRIGNAAVQLASSAVAASGEAAIEAKEAYKQFKGDREQEFKEANAAYIQEAESKLGEKYEPKVLQIQREYEATKGKAMTTTADGSAVDLAYIRYQEKMAKLKQDYQKELAPYKAIANDRYNKAMQNIETEAKSVGNKVMAVNQVLLTAGNMIQFGKAFSKSFKNAAGLEASINKFATKKAISTTTEEAIRKAEQATARAASESGEKALIEGVETTLHKPFLGKTGAALKGVVTEGSEEMNQQWISSGAQAYHKLQHKDVNDYWKDKYDKDEKDWNGVTTLAAIVQGLDDSWGDPKQYEQFLVGAMMGGVGMPTATKAGKSDTNKAWYNPTRWLSWEGGIYGELKEYNAKQKTNQEAHDALNTLLQDPQLQTTIKKIAERTNDNLILSKIQAEQDKAVEAGNKQEYKDLEDKYFAHAINIFAKAGRMDDLKAMYSYYANLNDNEIDNLVNENIKGAWVDAEQDKKNYIASQIKEREKFKGKLAEAQEEIKEANKAGDKKTADQYKGLAESYAQAIQEINNGIENYQGEGHYAPNMLVDSKGQRKEGFETNDKVRDSLKKNSEALLEKIDTYERGARLIQEQFAGKLDNDKEDNLLYLWMRNKGAIQRFNSMFDTLTKSTIFPNKVTISKKETFRDQEGKKEEEVTHKNAETLAESLGLDKDLVRENANGDFDIDLNSIPKERAGAILTRVLASDENTKLLNEKLDKKASEITDPEKLNELSNDVNTFKDALHTYASGVEYWRTLQEYMRNPEAIEAKQQEAKAESADKEKNNAIKKEKLNKLVDKVLSGEVDPDAENESLDDENKEKLNTAKEIADAYKSMKQAINEEGEDPETIKLAQKMLDRSKKDAGSVEELIDPAREAFNSLLNEDGGMSPDEIASIKKLMDESKGLTSEEAEEILTGKVKSLIQVAKEAFDKKKAKAKATPKTKSKKSKPEDSNGVNDSINLVDSLEDNETLIEEGEDERGKYILVYTTEKGKAKIIHKFKFKRIKDGTVITEKGFVNMEAGNISITSNSYFTDDKLKTPFKVKTKTVKVTSIEKKANPEKGKDDIYVILEDTAYHKFKNGVHKTPVSGTMIKGSLDKVLNTKAGENGAVDLNATPIVIYTERDGTKMVTESRHIQGTQGATTEKELLESNYIKIATSQYRWHYRDAETINLLKDGEQFLTWHEYFNRKAALLEKSSSAMDKANAAKFRRKAERAKVLWDFMNNHGVFERRNATTTTGKVTFGYSKELNDALAAIKDNPAPPVILIFDENGNIIGDLVGPKDDAYSKYKKAGIDLLYAKGQEVLDNNPQYDNNGIVMIPDVSTTVKQHFIGTPNFTNTNNTLNSIMTEKDSSGTVREKLFKIGVVVGKGANTKMALTPGRKVSEKTLEDRIVPLPPSANKHIGKPYLLLETSDPTRPYLPVPILMSSYTDETANSTLGGIIRNHLGTLKEVLDSGDSSQLIAWRNKLASLLYFENNSKNNPTLFIEASDGNLTVSFKQDGSTVSDTLENYEEKSAGDIQNFLHSLLTDNSKLKYPMSFNISKEYINSSSTFENSGMDYNHVIGEVAMTNIAQGSPRTINDFISFTSLEEKDGKLQANQTDKGKKEKSTKQNPTSVITKTNTPKSVGNGYVITVQIDGITDYRVSDENGNQLTTKDKTPGELASIYCRAKGWKTGSHKTPYARERFNVKAQRFDEHYSDNDVVQKAMEDIYSLQDRVKRSETTSTHYYIEDESGEVQEIDRLHAAIDEKFGKSWLNDKKDEIEKSINEATASVKKALDSIKGTIDQSNKSFLTLVQPFVGLLGEQTANKVLVDNGFNPKSKNDYAKLLEALRLKTIDVQTKGHSYRALRAGQNYDEHARHFFKTGHVNYNDTSVFTREQLQEIERGLQAFKNAHPGWKFYADNLVVTGNLNGRQVAGEVDLIGIDPNGDMHIFDFKTSAKPFVINGQKSQEFGSIYHSSQQRTTESQYSIQLSSYGNMIEGSYGVNIAGIHLIPAQLIYDNNGRGDSVTQVIPQPTISNLTYYSNVFGLDSNFFNKKETHNAPIASPKSSGLEGDKKGDDSSTNKPQNNADTAKEEVKNQFKSLEDAQKVILDKIGRKRSLKDLKTLISSLNDADESIMKSLTILNTMLEDKDNLSILSAIKTIEELNNLNEPKYRKFEKHQRPMDIEKELEAVKKFIPNVEDAIIVKDLIRTAENSLAYGLYMNSAITLIRNADRGTLYHESFHFVMDKFITKAEAEEIFMEASFMWGNKSKMELEELLAEDFREYMQLQESFMGRLKLAWRRLKGRLKVISESRLYLDNLYRNINRGKHTKNDALPAKLQTDINELVNYYYGKSELSMFSMETVQALKEKGYTLDDYYNMTLEERETAIACL